MATTNPSAIFGAGSRVFFPWLLALCLSAPAVAQFNLGGSGAAGRSGGSGYRGRGYSSSSDPASIPFDPRSDRETWDSRFVPDLAWAKTSGAHPSAGPVFLEETILVPFTDRTVRGFSPSDGTESFSLRIEADPVGELAVFDGAVYLATLQGDLLRIDPVKGRTLFRAHLPEELRHQPVPVAKGVLVITRSNRIYFLSNRTGKVLWQRTGPGKGLLPPVPAPGGTAFVVSAEDGTLALLSLEKGEIKWETDLARGVSARPAISEDRIFIPTADRLLHAVDLDDGDERWSHRLGGAATATPLLVTEDGKTSVIVVTRDNVLQSLRAKNGFREWREKVPAPVAEPLAVRDGVLYATLASGNNILGFMVKNGYQLGTIPLGISSTQAGSATTAPDDYLVGAAAIHDHRALFASYSGRLLACKIITSAAIEEGREKFPERLRTASMTTGSAPQTSTMGAAATP